MKHKPDEKFFRRLLNNMISHKQIFSAVLSVESGDQRISWAGAAGNMEAGSRYFIASVTKLYVTAVVMRLIDEKRVTLDDRISKHLPEIDLNGLHVLKGTDHSGEITIRHLISNTSGLPDYFFHRQPGGKTVADSLMEGNDEAWPLERTIGLVRELKPNFSPGKKGKVAYSDTNYQLLGRIIENVTGKSISDVFREFLFDELQLRDTYFYSDISDRSPVPYYYQSKELWLPNYMVSVGPEGGIVSTAREVMIFLKAFFDGRFFAKERISELKQWNLILPPPGLFYFGVGLEKLYTPWIISPFKPIREILGFWGQTGSFAFYHPETDLYFTGTTNQINGAGHRAASGATVKIIRKAL
jgi:CubicO group peptidase (beta-lactamase class C family)